MHVNRKTQLTQFSAPLKIRVFAVVEGIRACDDFENPIFRCENAAVNNDGIVNFLDMTSHIYNFEWGLAPI